MYEHSLRDETIERLSLVGSPGSNAKRYKGAFDELLEIVEEVEEAGDASGLSIGEREKLSAFYLEIEKVLSMPEGSQYFLPSQLLNASVWNGMREAARTLASELSQR